MAILFSASEFHKLETTKNKLKKKVAQNLFLKKTQIVLNSIEMEAGNQKPARHKTSGIEK